jgi:L-threonylcarbamoyladenylate synthase
MTIHEVTEENQAELISRIVAEMRSGAIWGMGADSAYALCADAFSPRALASITQMRNKGEFVTPIFIGREINLDGLVDGVGDDVRALIKEFWPGPLTLLATPQPMLAWGASRDAISIRMPADEFTRAVAYELGPMVAVAASRGTRSAPTTVVQAAETWGSDVPNWVNRGELDSNLQSTVIDIRGAKPNIVRLGAISKAELRAVANTVTMIAT